MQPEVKSVVCQITCLKCKNASRVRIINDTEVMYIDQTPIIACRLRPDMIWGFECICGNDSRLSPQEVPMANVLVSGAHQSVIDRVIATTKIKPEKKFRMVEA